MKIFCAFSAVLKLAFAAWLLGFATGLYLGLGAASGDSADSPPPRADSSAQLRPQPEPERGREVFRWSRTSTSCCSAGC